MPKNYRHFNFKKLITAYFSCVRGKKERKNTVFNRNYIF
jgi:hypothetical protein